MFLCDNISRKRIVMLLKNMDNCSIAIPHHTQFLIRKAVQYVWQYWTRGPREALSVEILSTAAQLYENKKANIRWQDSEPPITGY